MTHTLRRRSFPRPRPARVAHLLVLGAILGNLAAVLSACNTTEGFGKDVKKLGNNIETSADEHK
jgi:predicted small secreted protein